MCLIAGLIAAFLAWCGKILRISFIIGLLGLCWLVIKAWEAWDMIGDYIILTFQLNWKTGCFLCIPFVAVFLIIISYIRTIMHSVGVPLPLRKFRLVRRAIQEKWVIYFFATVLFSVIAVQIPKLYIASAAYSAGASVEQLQSEGYGNLVTSQSLWICSAICLLCIISIFSTEERKKDDIGQSKMVYTLLHDKPSITVGDMEQCVQNLVHNFGVSEQEAESLVRSYAEYAQKTILEPTVKATDGDEST